MPAGAIRPTGLSAPRTARDVRRRGRRSRSRSSSCYLVCLAFAVAPGARATATSFVYAYLAGSCARLGHGGLARDASRPSAALAPASAPERRPRHVVRDHRGSRWSLVGAAAGTFALAGGSVVQAALGSAFEGDVGSDLGRLVVALSPWMVASIGVWVTFPLAFVAGRTRRLPALSAAALALQVPLASAGAAWLELNGLALSLALTTLLVLVALLRELDALAEAARPLATATLVIVGVSLLAFVPAGGRPRVVRGGGGRARPLRRAAPRSSDRAASSSAGATSAPYAEPSESER